MRTSLLLLATFLLATALPAQRPPDPSPHIAEGRARLGVAARQQRPVNIILMISDGCGYDQLLAANYYQHGRAAAQPYESWEVKYAMASPHLGLVYDPEAAWKHFHWVARAYTDSAAAATAMACGEKTYSGAIGVDADGSPILSIGTLAEQLGKSSGVVSSVPLSHATPAAFVACNPSRHNYEGIARQMIEKSGAEVIIGAGAPDYDNNGQPLADDAKPQYKYVGGEDLWKQISKGQVEGADADGDGEADAWTVVRDRQAFQKLATGEAPKRLLGIPRVGSTFQQGRRGRDDQPGTAGYGGGSKETAPYEDPRNEGVPTLAECTKAALNVLDDNPEGFFLMVEGGAVDWAGHANQKGRIIEEEIEFNEAVAAVIAWVGDNGGWEQNLVIVTGDHETGYLTGPGSGPHPRPHWNPVVNNGRERLPGMQFNSGGHTNSLIPFFAKGAGSQLFHLSAKHRSGNRPDPVHGLYLDNTDIAIVTHNLWIQD